MLNGYRILLMTIMFRSSLSILPNAEGLLLSLLIILLSGDTLMETRNL